MNFGEALEAIKKGKQAYRRGWNGVQAGKRMYIEIFDVEYGYQFNEGNAVGRCIAIITNGYTQPGWLASQQDMLAEDWEIE